LRTQSARYARSIPIPPSITLEFIITWGEKAIRSRLMICRLRRSLYNIIWLYLAMTSIFGRSMGW
jgi:hypothetical protein